MWLLGTAVRLAGSRAVEVNDAPLANPLTRQGFAAIGRYGAAAGPAVAYEHIAPAHGLADGLAEVEASANGKAAAKVKALFGWFPERCR